MIIAKEKTSDSLLYVSSVRISGAVHRAVWPVFRVALRRIGVCSDCRETKIRDSCVASVIREDTWLNKCQYYREVG